MGYGNHDGSDTHDGYPRKTAATLAVKDQSKVTSGPLKSEDQADALIAMVLAGEDPSKLMNDAISQIDEGQGGGPFPIGSGVRVNAATTAEKVGGGSVALKQGDTVYVVQTNLGEHGTDKMVLLSDGSTRVIVPLAALGEADISTGPSGHEVPSAKGKETVKPSNPQGQKDPKDIPSAQSAGSSAASSHPSTPQVAAAPKDDKSAQKAGASAARGLNPSKAVEAKAEILQNLDMMLDGNEDAGAYMRVNELRRKVESLNPEVQKQIDALGMLHVMLFDKDQEYPFEQLETVVEAGYPNGNGKDGKDKKPFGGMKQTMKGEAHNGHDDMNGKDNGKDNKDNKEKKPNPFAKKNGNGNGDGKEEGLPALRSVPALEQGKNGGMQPSAGGTKDKPIPQGKPGKNETPPGLKEEAGKAMTSIFTRLDEDTNKNLEGNAKQFQR